MKTPPPQFLAEVEEGKIKVLAHLAYRAFLQKHVGKRVYLVIKPVTKTRTTNQNSYYWGGVLTPISDHTGYSVEDLHELFKGMFIGRQEITWRGVKHKIPPSSKIKDTKEFGEYIDKITVEATDLGVKILTPEEYYEQFNIDK